MHGSMNVNSSCVTAVSEGAQWKKELIGVRKREANRYILLWKVSNSPPGLLVYVRSATGHMGSYETGKGAAKA
jgi:hypothetical protein